MYSSSIAAHSALGRRRGGRLVRRSAAGSAWRVSSSGSGRWSRPGVQRRPARASPSDERDARRESTRRLAIGWHGVASKEMLEIGGREVSVSNPDKVYFPRAGHTKLDLVRYFLAVADGALAGVRGRPMALKRFVDGAEKEPFFQKRAPDNRPDWMRDRDAHVPVRADGRRDRRRRGRPGSRGSRTSAASTSTRTPSAPRTSTTPTSCASTSTRCRACPGRRCARSRSSSTRRSRPSGLIGWPKTSGSRGIHVNVRIEPRWTYPQVRRAALALARDVERRAPADRDLEVVEGGAPRRVPRLQPEREGPDGRVRLLRAARPRTPGSRSRSAGTRSRTSSMEDFTLATVPAIYAERGDAGAGIDGGRRLARRAARAVRPPRGRGPGRRARGRRTTRSRRASRRASSRREAPQAATSYAGRGKDGGPPPEVAEERAAAVAAGRPERRACRPSGRARGRRRPAAAGRASRSSSSRGPPTKAEVYEGLERWKARHPEAAAHLEPADVIDDGDARPGLRLVPAAAQPDPRAGGPAARPRSRSIPTTTRGRATSGPTERAARRGRAHEGRGGQSQRWTLRPPETDRRAGGGGQQRRLRPVLLQLGRRRRSPGDRGLEAVGASRTAAIVRGACARFPGGAGHGSSGAPGRARANLPDGDAFEDDDDAFLA